MKVEERQEVWSFVDRDHLRRLIEAGPAPVFATISGAHLYGFASADSDVDLRGAFMWTARQMLGLRRPKETISVDEGAAAVDWVAHDIRKFARLMTNHNGYVLEQLYSPLVVVTTPAHDELMRLGRGCITRPTFRHYRGFARGRRERLRQPGATVKHLLYAYRVLLSGIHMMRSGEVVSHLPSLVAAAGVAEVEELIARKRGGTEKLLLDEGDLVRHEPVLDRLDSALETAHGASHLPEEPTTRGALEDFVVQLRIRAAGARP